MLTESLLQAAAEAILANLGEDLSQSLSATREADPKRLALQISLSKAYAELFERYPDWVRSLYDDYFLTHEVARILARHLAPGRYHGSGDLAKEWHRRLDTFQAIVLTIEEVAEPASFFLAAFEDSLFARAEFRALFETRSLDLISRSVQDVASAVKGLRTELVDAIDYAQVVRPLSYASDSQQGSRQEQPSNPYVGLAPFRVIDQHLFFGREDELPHLLSVLDAHRVLILVGSSGSGKSSLVQASVVPALLQRDGWMATILRPGRDPFRALASALVALFTPSLGGVEAFRSARELAVVLAEEGLAAVLDGVPALSARSHLLLVVDQFEELVTHSPDPIFAQRFISTLMGAVDVMNRRPSGPRLGIIVTLRSDFSEEALDRFSFGRAISPCVVHLAPMEAESLRRAIAAPATLRGVTMHPELVEQMVRDVKGRPGSLPLLEFTLTLLWEKGAGKDIGLSEYASIGGVTGALAQHADRVYQALSATARERVPRIFRALTPLGWSEQVGIGSALSADRFDVRRVATIEDFQPGDWDIVRQLAGERLVVMDYDTMGRPTVEIAHEALLRSWDTLKEWTADENALRVVLGHFATGVTVVTGTWMNEPVGATVNSFTALSLDPPLVAFAVSKSSPTWRQLASTRRFCVNILSQEQEAVSRSFAGPVTRRFRGVGWHRGPSGSPILSEVLAWIECSIEMVYDGGDHWIVVGLVHEFETAAAGGPLVFYRGGYGTFEL